MADGCEVTRRSDAPMFAMGQASLKRGEEVVRSLAPPKSRAQGETSRHQDIETMASARSFLGRRRREASILLRYAGPRKIDLTFNRP